MESEAAMLHGGRTMAKTGDVANCWESKAVGFRIDPTHELNICQKREEWGKTKNNKYRNEHKCLSQRAANRPVRLILISSSSL